MGAAATLDVARCASTGVAPLDGALLVETHARLWRTTPPELPDLGPCTGWRRHFGNERAARRLLDALVTNVPGPQYPLYAVGRRMLEAFPYVPLGGNVRVGVAIFSYDGGLNFGVTGDYDTSEDLQVLCDGIEAGLAELLAAASPAARPARRRRAPAPSRGSEAG